MSQATLCSIKPRYAGILLGLPSRRPLGGGGGLCFPRPSFCPSSLRPPRKPLNHTPGPGSLHCPASTRTPRASLDSNDAIPSLGPQGCRNSRGEWKPSRAAILGTPQSLSSARSCHEAAPGASHRGHTDTTLNGHLGNAATRKDPRGSGDHYPSWCQPMETGRLPGVGDS